MINKDIKNFPLPHIDLEKFNYELPQDRIAAYPLANRAESKLLIADARKNLVNHGIFSDIPSLLPENSTLVINETKVITARIKAKKETGGHAEILAVAPADGKDPQIALSEKGASEWNCIIGGRKIVAGSKLVQSDGNDFIAEIIEKNENNARVKFTYSDELTFSEILEQSGQTPLPPYIKRNPEKEDKERYQTVYARNDGSVAAPTAGLHFTDEVFQKLAAKNINKINLTLHVGPGTFRPIDKSVREHDMHFEQIVVSRHAFEELYSHFNDNRKNWLVATGTTSLRTLESLYWLGAMAVIENKNELETTLIQNSPYYYSNNFKLPESAHTFERIAEIMDKQGLSEIRANTQLFIVPGYQFHTADALITNFHMPKSTLILLVAAFIGENLWNDAYSEALAGSYRFLSYGDSSLMIR